MASPLRIGEDSAGRSLEDGPAGQAGQSRNAGQEALTIVKGAGDVAWRGHGGRDGGERRRDPEQMKERAARILRRGGRGDERNGSTAEDAVAFSRSCRKNGTGLHCNGDDRRLACGREKAEGWTRGPVRRGGCLDMCGSAAEATGHKTPKFGRAR